MGLLDFLSKGKNKSAQTNPQISAQQTNPNESDFTNIPMGGGGIPMPRPGVNSNSLAGSVNPGQIPQAQNYTSNNLSDLAEDDFTPIQENEAGGAVQSQAITPLQPYDFGNQQLYSSDPNSMMSESEQADPLQLDNVMNDQNPANVDYQVNNNETIFGEGDLSDVYSQNFPDPNNMQPMLPNSIDQNLTNNQHDQLYVEQNDQGMQNPAQITQDQQIDASSENMSMSDITQANPIPNFQMPDLSNLPGMSDFSNSQDSSSNPVLESQNLEDTNISDQVSEDSAVAIPQVVSDDNLSEKLNDIETVGDESAISPLAVSAALEASPVVDSKSNEIDPSSDSIIEEAPRSHKKVFKKVGVLGIDGPNMASINAQDVVDLASRLMEDNVEIFVDSDGSLASQIASVTEGVKHRANFVVHKPMMSESTVDQVNLEGRGSLFTVVYSNYIDWMHHLARESRLFAVFDGGGLKNHALLLSLINLSKMYFGKHKPIILVGSTWRLKVDALVTAGVIGGDDAKGVEIANSVEEFFVLLNKINEQFSNVSDTSLPKILDKRVRGDEKEFFIY